MPRVARVIVPGVPYHVTARGNFRKTIFRSMQDFAYYAELINYYSEINEVKIYAWCLMSNHVHFVLEPAHEDSFAKMFRLVQMRYSKYKNKKAKRFGHRWQGRFFSCPLDLKHLYECIRYVELNPIRAKMTNDLTHYPYSSAGFRSNSQQFIRIDSSYHYLEIDDWKAYLEEKADEDVIQSIELNTETGRPAGDKIFQNTIEAAVKRSLAKKSAGRKTSMPRVKKTSVPPRMPDI